MMNIIKHVLVPVMLLATPFLSAQSTSTDSITAPRSEKINQQIELLKSSKAKIEKEERELLKQEVAQINKRLDAKEISIDTAQQLKENAAKKRAANIQDRIAIIDRQIAILQRNNNENDSYLLRIGGSNDETTNDNFVFLGKKSKDKPKKYDLRTSSDLVFAIGFNNAIIEGESINDSPYSLGGSGFVELGYAWRTRVFKNSNALRLKYGVSLQWNKLNIKDNNYVVNTNDVITLEQFPENARKIKFRTTNLVFPVHFEFGPSKKKEYKTYFRYSTRNQFKFGIGGYGGFNIRALQKIKYDDANGDRQKDKFKNRYNTTNIVYGLSSYIALGNKALYVKYDLNPIFNNQAIDQNNISVGIRFDMD